MLLRVHALYCRRLPAAGDMGCHHIESLIVDLMRDRSADMVDSLRVLQPLTALLPTDGLLRLLSTAVENRYGCLPTVPYVAQAR